MRSIKVIGIIIPFIALVLAYFSSYKGEQNLLNKDIVNNINSQKAFTQEVSKNIFYIYKSKDSSDKDLESTIKKFLDNKSETAKQSPEIIKLWNKFYLDVQLFRDNIKSKNPYSSIILEDSVKNIYNTNIKLVALFNKQIEDIEKDHNNRIKIYKYIEYSLYFLFIVLLIYLATKLHYIVEFIQRFLKTSDTVLKNSTIKGIEPIKVKADDAALELASENFNQLVQKINISIEYSTSSLNHSYNSLQDVEKNIESFLELLNSMKNSDSDKKLSQKEDAVIEALEEILNATGKLKNLEQELKELLT